MSSPVSTIESFPEASEYTSTLTNVVDSDAAAAESRKRSLPYETTAGSGGNDSSCNGQTKKRKGEVLPQLSFDKLEEYRRLFAPLNKEQIFDILTRACGVYDDVYFTAREIVDESPAARRLMIRNISFQTENASLYSTFSQFGRIEDFTIVREKDTNKSKGFGFVTFKSVEAVEAALTNNTVLDGRNIIVKLAADTHSETSGSSPFSSGGNTGGGSGSGGFNSSYGTSGDSKLRRKIFVRNLSDKTTTEKLRQTFAQFGAMEDCVVVQDPNTGRSKGYGFMTFQKQEDAFRAIQQSQRIIDDQMAFVAFASPSGSSGQSGSNYSQNRMQQPAMPAYHLSAAGQSGMRLSPQQPMSPAYSQAPMGVTHQTIPHQQQVASDNTAAVGSHLHQFNTPTPINTSTFGGAGTNGQGYNMQQYYSNGSTAGSYLPSVQRQQSLQPSYNQATPQNLQQPGTPSQQHRTTMTGQYDPNAAAAASAAVAAATAAAIHSAHRYCPQQQQLQSSPAPSINAGNGRAVSAPTPNATYGSSTGLSQAYCQQPLTTDFNANTSTPGGTYQMSKDSGFVSGW